MTEHQLKIDSKYFDAVKNGIKTFEVRKNDRDYKVGDTLFLKCKDGEVVYCAVKYILTDKDFPDGIKDGYCVMALEKIE